MSGGHVVLLTGATGLLGRKFAAALLAGGSTVVAVGRRRETLDDLGRDLAPAAAGRFVPLAIDLKTADFADLARELGDRGLAPHGLINNARDSGNLAGAHPWPSREAWLSEFELGVVRPVQLAACLAEAAGTRLASVVNVASIYGIVAVNPNIYENPATGTPMHYGPTKAALIMATKELAVRLAPAVRVNAISYGGVAGRAPAELALRYAALAPQRSMLDPNDVAGAAVFLLSDAARAVTGHNLVVDGGWTAW
jgi:NAD(P)-dependent dehydrogenase (short-subunit alcohol dehydrogenase family)